MQKVRRYNELLIVALAFKCAEKSGFKSNMGNLVEAVGQIKGFHSRYAPFAWRAHRGFLT
jgi:hypothetical protein